jgi:hypothetical protein
MLRNIPEEQRPTNCLLSTKLHKSDAFHYDCTWPEGEKDVNFSSDASVEKELATPDISSIYILCNAHVGGRSSARRKREMNVTLNQ